jgi:hypothetical protein
VSTLEQLRTVAQILYYIALSITGPLALFGYLRAKQNEHCPAGKMPEMAAYLNTQTYLTRSTLTRCKRPPGERH